MVGLGDLSGLFSNLKGSAFLKGKVIKKAEVKSVCCLLLQVNMLISDKHEGICLFTTPFQKNNIS